MQDSGRTRLIVGVLLALALALITVDARDGSIAPMSDLRSAGGSVFGTAEALVGSVANPVGGFFAGGGSSAQARISALRRQNTQLRADLSQARLAKSESAQLQRLLGLAGRGRYRIVAATVVARGPAYEDTVTINVGSAAGVKPEETVLDGDGLVGEVTSVSDATSTVVLDTDASSRVGVRVAGTGEAGLVSGTGRTQSGPAALTLQVFDENAVLHAGEQLVTFGSVNGRPYVPGVPVGVITKVEASASALTKVAMVRPFADDGEVSVVGVVIAPPRQNPHDSVLPHPPATPAPPPAPRHTVNATPSPTVSAGAGTGAGG